MTSQWTQAIGPSSIWGLQDNVLEQIEAILEARVAAEFYFLERIGQELTALNDGLDALLYPTRVIKGKLESEPNPLAELWRTTYFGKFISQFVSLVDDDFNAGKQEYERLKQELETFKTGAQAIRASRPNTTDVDQLEQSLVTAYRRCENAQEVYEKRCKEFQDVNAKPKSRLGSLKSSKHNRNPSTSSLLSMDDPGINTADHDYRKAIVVANTLREQRIAIYRAGYPTLQKSTEQTLELVKSAMLVQSSLATERASSRARRYETTVDQLMTWKPHKDAAELCAFIPSEQNLIPPEIFRHDAITGWMKRVLFCVPISYLPCNREGVPRILEQCFGVCLSILKQANWDEQEAAHFATTPKLSASRFEEVIISVEKEESELTVTVRNIPEALGLMNYLFFSLPRPLLQLNATIIADPDLSRTWWESSRDQRKVVELFRADSLDRTAERTLRFLLERISQILPHARNLHIVDVAMAWARPLFQNPRPSNAEVTVLCVLFRQALLLHRHDHDQRWLALWTRGSLQRSGTLLGNGYSSSAASTNSATSSGTLTQPPSRQLTTTSSHKPSPSRSTFTQYTHKSSPSQSQSISRQATGGSKMI
ncbi:SubName: Full=Uncharacterized protein {ECO:0000313/EMBL:CCA67584.1} [Serendipita indica DSM 11827]|uniref:Rho-GAP domain-containing protein n=1 Tax=Serendipita indica (strain DSM 11827) TaxID=1109443 RepID=G4T8D1_SERID|nr:SubName: Full=Uncharacterized protein {ECO:0000313/EMBL:CCA67584.1} [Serendipita indica DSM 11827]CCA67584.1 hypothetical protein PIIN_01412 [Serendipita indica DSM 11827]